MRFWARILGYYQSAINLSILFMRFYVFVNSYAASISAFNSLYEILAYTSKSSNILISAFQFSLWDSESNGQGHPVTLLQLSILFMRFEWAKLPGYGQVLIPLYFNFQFSLWDSTNSYSTNKWYLQSFQFSLWDSFF